MFFSFQVMGSWNLGHLACLFWISMDVWLSSASVIHLCIIAVNRYLGIAYPLKFHNHASKFRTSMLLTVIWILSFLIALSLIVLGFIEPSVVIMKTDTTYQCGIFNRKYALYSSMASFFVPMALKVFADIRSVKLLQKNASANRYVACSRGENSCSYARTFSTYEPESEVVREPAVYRSYVSRENSRSADVSEVTMTTSLSPSTAPSPDRSSNQLILPSPNEAPEVRVYDFRPSGAAVDDNGYSRKKYRRANSQDHSNQAPRKNSRAQSCPKLSVTRCSLVFSEMSQGNADMGHSYRLTWMKRRSTICENEATKISNNNERKAQRTLIIVFICFVALWLPFFTVQIVYSVCMSCNPDSFGLAFEITTWLGYSASGVNPCIYTLFNKNFRKAFRYLFPMSCPRWVSR